MNDIKNLKENLTLAYKKAKVDIFYSTSNGDYSSLLSYEKNLKTNLDTLYKEIEQAVSSEKNDSQYFQTSDFLGTYTFCGKSYDLTIEQKSSFQFRLMAQPSVAFHVLSSLWLNLIGSIFDKAFPNDHLYAYRMRRTKENELNSKALGNFIPYSHQYQKWQNNALGVIQQELEAKRNVASVSLDVKNFYYSVNPSFLTEQEYKDKILNNSSDREWLVKFHLLFVKVLQNWDTNFPDISKHIGIPVGLPASGLIANLALQTFDKIVINELRPLSYGRYVDDIIIVIKNNEKDSEINCIESFFSFLALHTPNHSIQKLNEAETQWIFKDKSGVFIFNSKKQQFLEFKRQKGLVCLQLFRKQLAERASEWRALPNLPPADQINTKMIKILEDGESGLRFRDCSNLSVLRSKFCFILRDCEIFARTFSPDIWATTRKAFLTTFSEFIIDPPIFFKFEKYLFRVLVLGVLGKDYQEIATILDRIESSIYLELEKCDCNIAGFNLENTKKDSLIHIYKKYICSIIFAALNQTNPDFMIDEFREFLKEGKEIIKAYDKKENRFEEFFLHDLAVFPIKSLLVSNEQTPLYLYSFGNTFLRSCYFSEDSPFEISVVEMFHRIIENTTSYLPINLNEKEYHWNIDNYWYFFQYNTRPLTEYDMYFMLDDMASLENSRTLKENDLPNNKIFDRNLFINLLQFFRGYSKKIDDHSFEIKIGFYNIPNTVNSKEKCSIAIVCTSMEEEKLKLQLGNQFDEESLIRYKRFTKIVNEILSTSEKIDYLVFPELALPPRWFIGAAHKLQKKGINLISGIEYLTYPDKGVISNQVWMALNHTVFDYNSYAIIRQRKQYPAYHELAMIRKEQLAEWIPDLQSRKQTETRWPTVIKHGEFFFSVLVCAELMNIQYRNNLRGKIDCLFVPEWNPDTTSFNDLINASSLDLHAYVVQCNNNKYGDCRLRGPFKKEYMRDIVKAKGGKNDYFIVGEIDFKALRKYQLSVEPDDSSNAIFKPFPIGYTISQERKAIYMKKDT